MTELYQATLYRMYGGSTHITFAKIHSIVRTYKLNMILPPHYFVMHVYGVLRPCAIVFPLYKYFHFICWKAEQAVSRNFSCFTRAQFCIIKGLDNKYSVDCSCVYKAYRVCCLLNTYLYVRFFLFYTTPERLYPHFLA